MNIAAQNLIKKYEGFSNKVYLCPAGYKTIGYGHRIAEGEAVEEVIGEDKADEILRLDIIRAENSVLRLININLSEGQAAALISFTFNLGAAALQRSALRRKINSGEEDIEEEFLRWVYVKGRKVKGLILRRAEEWRHYRG